MNEHEIKKLIKIVEESNIDELEVSRWGRRVRIIKNRQSGNGVMPTPLLTTQPMHAPAPGMVGADAPEPELKEEKKEPSGNLIEIKSPMVGTFYRAPAPDSDMYVVVGDTVKVGDVLCIVEAMKLMNELESEHSGKIVEILVENAKAVQYNQPIFIIDVG